MPEENREEEARRKSAEKAARHARDTELDRRKVVNDARAKLGKVVAPPLVTEGI